MAESARMHPRFGLLACLACFACMACSEPPPRAADDYPISKEALGVARSSREAGEAAYQRTCIACHGADGRGNGGKTAADLTAPDGPLTRPDSLLFASIRDGKQGPIGTMPAHGALLSQAELEAVVAYTRKRFGAGILVREANDAGMPPTSRP